MSYGQNSSFPIHFQEEPIESRNLCQGQHQPTNTSKASFTICASLRRSVAWRSCRSIGTAESQGKERGVRVWTRSSRMHGRRNSRSCSSPLSTESRGASSIFSKSWTSSTVLGIVFISRRENVDTSGPMGRLFLTLIGSIAELESDLIRERVLAGMRRAKLDGVRIGRDSDEHRSGSHRPRPTQRHDTDGRRQEVGHFPQPSLQAGEEITGLVTKAPCRRHPLC